MRPKGSAKTPGSGRTKGTPNRLAADVREIAREYTEAALGTLSKIMLNPKSHDASRVAAARELLDRGWGKATQPIAAEGGPVRLDIRWLGDDEVPEP